MNSFFVITLGDIVGLSLLALAVLIFGATWLWFVARAAVAKWRSKRK